MHASPSLSQTPRHFLARYGIYVVVLAAFALRVAVVMHGVNLPIERDEAVYAKLARALLANPFTYVEVLRPPLYPAFMALIYATMGAGRFALEYVQALLDAVNVALVFALARLLFRRRAVALLAAGLYALYPEAIALTREFYSETLFDLFVLAAFWLLIRFTPTRARLPLLLAGVLLALAALTREIVFYFALLVIPLWFVLTAGGIKRPVVFQALALWAGLLLVLVPWSARNWSIEGRFVPISTSGEFNLLKDNLKAQARIECGTFTSRPDSGVRKCIQYKTSALKQLGQASPAERAAVVGRGAWEIVSKYPLAWLNAKLAPMNQLWMPPYWKVYYFRVKLLAPAARQVFDFGVGGYHVLFLLLAAYGILAARDDSAKLLVALYLLSALLIFILTHFQARYRIPLFTVLMPYAAFGILELAAVVRHGIRACAALGKPRVYAGTLLIALLVILIVKSAWF